MSKDLQQHIADLATEIEFSDLGGDERAYGVDDPSGTPAGKYLLLNKLAWLAGTQTITGAKTFTGVLTASNDFSVTGTSYLTAGGRLRLGNATVSQWTSDQNNWTPTDTIHRVSTDNDARKLTGVALTTANGGVQTVFLVNVGSNDLVLAHEDAGSSSANRLLNDTGGDITLEPNQIAFLHADPTAGKSRCTKLGQPTAAQILTQLQSLTNLDNFNGANWEDLTDGGDTTLHHHAAFGANVDVSGFKIVSSSNGDIDIEPHGTGNVLLGNFTFNADQSVGSGQDNYVLTYDNSAGTVGLEVPQVAPYTGQGPFTIREVSQATYDGLGTPDADTIYLITS